MRNTRSLFTCIAIFVLCCIYGFCKVEVGVDRLFLPPYRNLVEHKRIGLITNQTGITSQCESTIELFEKKHDEDVLILQALFAPEHGLYGTEEANQKVAHQKTSRGIPIYSLYGETRRPTKQMLENIDTFVYDIQDIGSRSYTYVSTLFYVMEEAAKAGKEVVVLDRPNPLGGKFVDGPMLEQNFRSFVGYINVPYCHGMTVGELARFFNEEYAIHCTLHVVPMKGWQRWMRFEKTGLPWIPTSPHIPEPSTPCFYPATGIVGELGGVGSIGLGINPFKIIAAPWMDGKKMAKLLNRGVVKGIRFQPTWIRPSLGSSHGQLSSGVLLIVTDWEQFNPIRTQYAILDALRQLYPEQLKKALTKHKQPRAIFHLVVGSRAIYDILLHESHPFAALCLLHKEERQTFLNTRHKYLIPAYSADFGTQSPNLLKK
jgi:uncharacterized protein YbbC (DUF1343 family)